MNIGAQIKLARLAAGLSQKQLGEAIGQPSLDAQRNISRWEQGKRTPSAHALYHISKVVGQPMEYFFEDTNQ